MENNAFLEAWLQLLRENKAIAIIRSPDFDLAYNMALAVAAGGANLIEITWSGERSGELITKLRTELSHHTIGTGTILNLPQLQQAYLAGAQFAFAPHFDPTLLEVSLSRYKIPFIPGVSSPTELVNAWQHGAKVVKVFPIKFLGGAEYIRCLQGPLKQIPLIPTGGITIDNARETIDAGAIAVGISSNLFPQEAILNRDWSSITTRTQMLLHKLHRH